MRKILLIILFSMLLQPVMAKNVKVESMSDFSTANPPETWEVKVVEGFVTKNGYKIAPNSIITGEIVGVKNPKRLKRDASFEFIPVYFQDSITGETYQVKRNFVGKYNAIADITAKDAAKKGAYLVGNHVLDGFLGPGIGVIEGLAKNEEGNRVKSVAVSVYNKTPLSYTNKGKDLVFPNGDLLDRTYTCNIYQGEAFVDYEFIKE